MSGESRSRVCRPDEVGYPARRGRATVLQKRALREFLPRYEVLAGEFEVNWELEFGRSGELIAEFGCGHGELTAEWAEANPGGDHVAFEVYPPGLGSLVAELALRDLGNVRVVRADAGRYAGRMFGCGVLSEARMFFPDPWPKRRHWKRALLNGDFAGMLSSRLRVGGILHLATDVEICARRMGEVMGAFPEFELASELGRRGRPQTRFERRAIREGREIREMVYRRR